jgi:SSS family solute:Na+ symporter
MFNLSLIDFGVVSFFIIVIVWFGFRERKRITLSDYWVNSRNTGTFPLTATMSSSFLGASAIFALAAISYEGGLAGFYIGLSFVVYFLLFGFLFAPKIQKLGAKHNIFTMPQAFGLRYGSRVRILTALVSMIAFGLFMAVQFLAIGGLVSLFGNINLTIATLLGGLVVVTYVSVGGLRADIRTDIIQFFVMLLLVLVFIPLLIVHSGGFDVLGTLPSNFWSGTAFLPLPLLIAAIILLGPTIFTSLDVWQRALAARSAQTARRGMNLAGLTLLPFFGMAALIGLFGWVLYPDIDVNLLVFRELVDVLPVGLLGVGLVGFFAAVMSSADTMLLVLSQTIVNDLYRRPLSESAALRLSRRYSFGLGILALVVAVVLLDLVDVAIGAVSFQVVLVPAAFGIFFWKRATSRGAFLSILVGALTIAGTLPFLGEQAFLPGFLASCIVFVLVSFLTEHTVHEKIDLVSS